MQVADRPPYVVFDFKPVEDRTASIAQGHYVTKDVPFATITRPGSKDSVVKEAEVWLKDLAENARQGKVPDSWAAGFKEKYEAWKKGESAPVNGTPIKGWPVLSPSAQKTVIEAGFLSVEDLAKAGDNEVIGIGTGAIAYKQKAVLWLEQASGAGKLVERVASLETKLSDLLTTNQALAAENDRLKKLLPKES